MGLIKHGYSGTCTYNIWKTMRQRCNNSKHKQYAAYGGRGIGICDRWLESFENFLGDMGKKPDGLSLDRIDNDGDYCPDNCRWATNSEQQKNRRTFGKSQYKHVTWDGSVNKWRGQIRISGKLYSTKRYVSEHCAFEAINKLKETI